MKEKYIEKETCKYAKQKGMLVFKFESTKVAGLPDRIFLYSGFVFFIEFKSKKGRLTVKQHEIIQNIEAQKIKVHIVCDFEDGVEIIDSYIKKAYTAKQIEFFHA